MRTALSLTLLTALWTTFTPPIAAQNTSSQTQAGPQFEVTSIKPSLSGSIQNLRPLPGRLTADVSTQVWIQYAYGIQPFQVIGGLDWLRSDRYRIEATADANANADRMFLMLRNLLGTRFQLKTHRETKELPVYALIAAKTGLTLPPPKDDGCVESAADSAVEWAGGRMAAPGELPAAKPRCGSIGLGFGPRGARLQGGRITMSELARRLSLMLDRAVIDRTGFTREFSLQVEFVPDETTPSMPPPPPNSGLSGLSLPEALRQLGLQLESTKGPVEVIVIDHAERPSAN